MSLWSKSAPPAWFPTAVATARGWENPITHEILVAVPSSGMLASPTHVTEIYADHSRYIPSSTITFAVYFNKATTVTGSPVLNFQFGSGNSRVATYLSGSGSSILVFTYAVAADGDFCSTGQLSVVSLALNGGAITGMTGDEVFIGTFTALATVRGGIIPASERVYPYPASLISVLLASVAVLPFDPAQLTQFFVDTTSGSNSNSGLSPFQAWATTDYADTAPAAENQVIWVKVSGGWQLYRAPDMTVDETDLTVDVMTGTASQY